MNRRLSLYLCFFAIALFAVSLTINSPLLTEIARTFHMTTAQSGFLFTANFIGFTAFVILGGVLADRLNKKTVITVCLLGLSAALLVFPLLHNVYAAIFIMFLIGGFGGVVESNLNAQVAEIYPEKAVFNINMVQVFFGIGAIVGPVVVGRMIQQGTSWQNCYLTVGALMLFVAVVFALTKMPRTVGDSRITMRAFLQLVKDKEFLIICVCMLFYVGSEVGSWGWLSTFLKENLFFSVTKSSIAVGAFWLAMTIGRFITARLTQKYKVRSIVIVLSLAAACSTLLAGVLSNAAAIWVSIGLMGFTYSGLFALIIAYGDGQYGENKGTVFSLFFCSGGAGGALVPVLMGYVAQWTNIRFAIASPAILLLTISILFLRRKSY